MAEAGGARRRTTSSPSCRSRTAVRASSTSWRPRPDGTTVLATTTDPLGREVPGALLFADSDGRRTAYVESAQATGLHLLAADERNPAITSTWGVGLLLDAALREGAERVIVGLGGSGTNDAGAGCWPASAPAVPTTWRVGACAGGPARRRPQGDRRRARAVRERRAARGHRRRLPLLGLGASAVFAPQKGASPALAQALEGRSGGSPRSSSAATTPDVTSSPAPLRRLDRQPGAGRPGWATA